MSIASIEGRRPQNVESRLSSPDQTKAIGSEESDEHALLGDLVRFVENSDQSIPRIAELMGVSGVALSMWIAGTARPTAIKVLEIKRFMELEQKGIGRKSVTPPKRTTDASVKAKSSSPPLLDGGRAS